MAKTHNFQELATAVIKNEAAAVATLAGRIGAQFNAACQLLLACKGRVVVTGMGKSGHIGGKIAATLASTGTPSFFVHPAEASHGDLGMITPQDLLLALSYSGETTEILTILPIIKRFGVPLIALTGNKNSTLAKFATCHLDVSVAQEACPLGLAPTSSTTAALVMGDALSVATLDAKGFSRTDFARSHPGGSLGKHLLLQVADIMHTDDAIPMVSATATVAHALLEMTEKKLGMTAVVASNKQVLGIFTDGDLRRMLGKNIPLDQRLSSVMTCGCRLITANILAAEAMEIMQQHKINALLIIDNSQRLIGALNMHDLIRAGIS